VIGRRAVLLAGASLAARPARAALPVPPGGSLAFRMVRHDSVIGHHALTFEAQGEALTVRVAVDALVTFISIPLARYRHRLVETWRGDKLFGLVGETDTNGLHAWINARRADEGLVVQGSHGPRYVAPENAIGISYWNKHQLEGPMISTDDGELVRPRVDARGTESVRLASGAMIAAEHYSLTGSLEADVWYDRAGTWASLELTVRDGSTVRYERL
jgi:hypothetical protein